MDGKEILWTRRSGRIIRYFLDIHGVSGENTLNYFFFRLKVIFHLVDYYLLHLVLHNTALSSECLRKYIYSNCK